MRDLVEIMDNTPERFKCPNLLQKERPQPPRLDHPGRNGQTPRTGTSGVQQKGAATDTRKRLSGEGNHRQRKVNLKKTKHSNKERAESNEVMHLTGSYGAEQKIPATTPRTGSFGEKLPDTPDPRIPDSPGASGAERVGGATNPRTGSSAERWQPASQRRRKGKTAGRVRPCHMARTAVQDSHITTMRSDRRTKICLEGKLQGGKWRDWRQPGHNHLGQRGMKERPSIRAGTSGERSRRRRNADQKKRTQKLPPRTGTAGAAQESAEASARKGSTRGQGSEAKSKKECIFIPRGKL